MYISKTCLTICERNNSLSYHSQCGFHLFEIIVVIPELMVFSLVTEKLRDVMGHSSEV